MQPPAFRRNISSVWNQRKQILPVRQKRAGKGQAQRAGTQRRDEWRTERGPAGSGVPLVATTPSPTIAPPVPARPREQQSSGLCPQFWSLRALNLLACLFLLLRSSNFQLSNSCSFSLLSPVLILHYISGLEKCWPCQLPKAWHQNLKCKNVYMMLAYYFSWCYFKLTNPHLLTEYSCHSTLV